MRRPVLLAILDGLGIAPDSETNALTKAHTPTLDALFSTPHGELLVSGEAVGLPAGQMGNSEVGHLNIGAGRVVDQDLNRISKEVREDKLKDRPVIKEAFNYVRRSNGKVHLVGLLSDGGVHSHVEHLYGLMKAAKEDGMDQVYIHGILDGRDVSPQAGMEQLVKLQEVIDAMGIGKLASFIGRYYAMDRDRRWERTKVAYDLLTLGIGQVTTDPVEAVETSYNRGVTDEFVYPHVMVENNHPVALIENGDAVIFYNFRPDRARQLSHALSTPSFDKFSRQVLPEIYLATMTEYDKELKHTHIIYEKEDLKNTLGEVVATHHKHQLRIAETEKYPHVTFFFNGGREKPFELEDRILIPSPKVATYDLQPEMSAPEVSKALIEAIESRKYDLIVLNFANPDMVGHTGDMNATVKALETVDEELAKILHSLLEVGGVALITSDHGNSEEMADEAGMPKTSHTTNRVPLFVVGDDRKIGSGKLSDLAPTILGLMGIPVPVEMTGKDLLGGA